MGQLLTTDTVAPRDRLAYWTDAICDVYVQLECDALRRDAPFDGRIRHDRLGTLELSRVTSCPQWVRHGPTQIARAAEDWFLVSLQTRGRGVVSQDGRDAVLEPGDFALYDGTGKLCLYMQVRAPVSVCLCRSVCLLGLDLIT